MDEALAQELQDQYPVPEYLCDITYLGGWDSIQNELYGLDGVRTKIIDVDKQKNEYSLKDYLDQ